MKLSEPGGGEGGAPAGEEDEDETVFLGPRADTRASLRKNRSNAPHLSMEPSKIELFRRGARAKSIQESESKLFSRIREAAKQNSRSVSFNGMSVVIDNLLSTYSQISRNTFPELLEAVSKEDTPTLRNLLRQNLVGLKDVLFKAVELNKPGLLSDMLVCPEDVNARHEQSGQALIHAAALTGSLECCELLVSKGADINVWDNTKELTPLHCAAMTLSRTKEVLEFLINNGGDYNAGIDKDGGSVLHAAVRSGNLAAVTLLLENNAQTVPKTFYESPLHTAAENNFVQIADTLLSHNRMLVDALKDEGARLTALHLAARHGYQDVARVLVNYNANVSLQCSNNETAVHYASRSRSEPVLRLILEKSRSTDVGLVNRGDKDGRSPLLVCTGSKGQGALECMQTLIDLGADLDVQDIGGFTALHVAAIDRKANRVNLLIENGADLSIKNKAGLTALYFINKKVPQCMKALESRLDSGMKLEGGPSELSAKIKLDFTKLSSNINSYQTQDITFFMELSTSPHQALLKHPLSEAFLYLKWNQIKYLYMIFIVCTHFIYCVVYTLYALLLYCSLCEPSVTQDPPANPWHIFNSTIPCNLSGPQSASQAATVNLAVSAWILLIIFIIIYIIKEILKLAASPRQYFIQLESYHDIVIIITTILIVWLNLLEDTIHIGRWQYHAACIGSFSTWLYMMFLIGRVPRFGKYVQMFKTVSMSVLNFMVAYVFLIIAFATTFMIAFPTNDAFALVPTAIVKLIVMMLGEIDYEDLYYSQSQHIINNSIETKVEPQLFPVTAQVFLFLFTVLVSIILMNLLVGLAVSDIQGLAKSARLHQLLQQVNLINYMEKLLFSPYFKYLPDIAQTLLRKKLQGLNVKYKTVYTVKPHDINDKTLPESLKRSIYDNCVRRDNRDELDLKQREVENMNRDIQRILYLLTGDAAVKPSTRQQRYNLQQTTVSDSLAVDDDLDSDLEVSLEDRSPRRRSRGGLRREASYISSASTASDGATLSDYIGVQDNNVDDMLV